MSRNSHKPPSQAALDRGYERPDVNHVALAIFFVAFAIFGMVVHVAIWNLLKFYTSLPRSADVSTSAAPMPPRFPPPNLQPIEKHDELPRQDLADLRAEKNRLFQQLGWQIDPDSGTAKIPDAIVDQMAGKGESR